MIPIGHLTRQWIELHISDGEKGRWPLLLPPKKESCPCCAGVRPFGQYRGHAVCETINASLHASEYARAIHVYMDKDTSDKYCKTGGQGCPLRPCKHVRGSEQRQSGAKPIRPEDRCVVCGEYVPEGRIVCSVCEGGGDRRD